MKKLIAILALLAAAGAAFSHSGGTDRSGCHTDHKTGSWHCH